MFLLLFRICFYKQSILRRSKFNFPFENWLDRSSSAHPRLTSGNRLREWESWVQLVKEEGLVELNQSIDRFLLANQAYTQSIKISIRLRYNLLISLSLRQLLLLHPSIHSSIPPMPLRTWIMSIIWTLWAEFAYLERYLAKRRDNIFLITIISHPSWFFIDSSSISLLLSFQTCISKLLVITKEQEPNRFEPRPSRFEEDHYFPNLWSHRMCIFTSEILELRLWVFLN